METCDNGAVEFSVGKVVFRFEKHNYDKHIIKRPKIESELGVLEETLQTPDCIASGPHDKRKRNYYKVLSYRDDGGVRYITFWKIPVYYRRDNLAIIATAIYATSPNFYAVNSLEKIIWKNPLSQI
jgi:hypothetical protein